MDRFTKEVAEILRARLGREPTVAECDAEIYRRYPPPPRPPPLSFPEKDCDCCCYDCCTH